MNTKNIFEEIQLKLVEAFISQDPEFFDIVFEIDGKKLYADKLRLSLASPIFKSMLSDRWNSNKNDAIKIKEYKFEDFKEFLTFIYSGKYNITDSNVINLLDISEFYQIHQLKEFCDEHVSKMKIDLENIFEFIELSNKYSMIQMKAPIQNYISQNFNKFIECNQFLNSNNLFLKEIITSDFIQKPDYVFQAVYEWSENQVIKKQKEFIAKSFNENFNKNDAIKKEITPFLPYIQLKKMEKSFLNGYFAERSYLFSKREVQNILQIANKFYKITITNDNTHSISGIIPYNYEVIEIIKSLKKRLSDNTGYGNLYWKTEHKIPSTSSSLKKSESVHWYLIYSYYLNGIALEKISQLNVRDYLIAEMIPDRSCFFVKPKCKIAIE